MIDAVSELSSLWEVVPTTVSLSGTGTVQLIGADVLRWCILIQPNFGGGPIVGTPLLRPWQVSGGVTWLLANLPQNPLRIDVRDYGAFPFGPWFVDPTGNNFTITVVSLRWKG